MLVTHKEERGGRFFTHVVNVGHNILRGMRTGYVLWDGRQQAEPL